MKRYDGFLCDVPGFRLGHATDTLGATGCSVILPPEGTIAGLDIRGGAPGTRESDVFRPENRVSECHAVFLAGGSAFGLDCAAGIMRYLKEQQVGFDTGIAKIPIVTGAVLFDLGVGSSERYPDAKMGYEACHSADFDDQSTGNVGAGAGASVGKLLGPERAMKSGIGQASLRLGALIVSAVTAVNAVGDIYDPNRQMERVAGLQGVSTMDILLKGISPDLSGRNTTIACVATNAKLTKEGALKVSQMAHDGFARSIRPVHTLMDGDSVFTLASREVEADPNLVGILAAEVITNAIVNACLSAASAYGLLGCDRTE